MARTIEKGATHFDKLCHKIYDEPKGCGFQVDGECIRCGGPLLDYYCEERLHLIVCKKCGTLALTKACAPQVAANLTLSRKPTLTPPNEWVAVEDRLPEDEARQYIEDELDGIGYLYPCLLTYKSPNTERIHVVRFYYDIIQKWFVNNVEELCEKGRCIAWMPLPAPYDRRPPERKDQK